MSNDVDEGLISSLMSITKRCQIPVWVGNTILWPMDHEFE